MGGASVLKMSNFFNVGEKNISGIKKLLEEAGFEVSNEETGGNISRTVTLELPGGRVTIKSPKVPLHEL